VKGLIYQAAAVAEVDGTLCYLRKYYERELYEILLNKPKTFATPRYLEKVLIFLVIVVIIISIIIIIIIIIIQEFIVIQLVK
jgi:hypothetical protein